MRLMLCFLLLGCVTQPTQELDPKIYYKRELDMRVNGSIAKGTFVAKKNNAYRIKINFPGKGDLVTLKTCHRETESEDLGRRETITFTPNEGMEDTGLCFLEIAAFEYKKGRHAWGLIDFHSEKFQLPAKIKCNGKTYISEGTTICQSKEGLFQKIEFGEPILFSEKSKCKPLPFDEGMRVSEFNMPNRECTFIFKGQESGKLHKLTTIGYEQIIIREL